jgi:hypothetical protein
MTTLVVAARRGSPFRIPNADEIIWNELVTGPPAAAAAAGPGLPDLSWCNIPKRGKMYQITIQYTKWPQYIPNGRKIGPMAIKYTNIFHSKSFQVLPKLGFLV